MNPSHICDFQSEEHPVRVSVSIMSGRGLVPVKEKAHHRQGVYVVMKLGELMR